MQALEIQFNDFHLQFSPNCDADYVMISDGKTVVCKVNCTCG